MDLIGVGLYEYADIYTPIGVNYTSNLFYVRRAYKRVMPTTSATYAHVYILGVL